MAATNKRTQTNIERKHLSATTRSYAVIMFTVWPLSSLPIMQNIVTCKGPPSMQRQRWKSFVLMLHQIFQDLNCLIWLKLSHFRLVLQCLWHSPSHKAGDAIFIALYCHRSNKVSCCVLKPFFGANFLSIARTGYIMCIVLSPVLFKSPPAIFHFRCGSISSTYPCNLTRYFTADMNNQLG